MLATAHGRTSNDDIFGFGAHGDAAGVKVLRQTRSRLRRLILRAHLGFLYAKVVTGVHGVPKRQRYIVV